MAHIVPSISFLKIFMGHLQSGKSVGLALDETVKEEQSEFSLQVLHWRARNQGSATPILFKACTHFQQAFFEIVGAGLEGAPVFELLVELEIEMLEEFDRQWKNYLEKLPMILSLPLLLFFFPAYVILMFGPLLTQFLNEVH